MALVVGLPTVSIRPARQSTSSGRTRSSWCAPDPVSAVEYRAAVPLRCSCVGALPSSDGRFLCTVTVKSLKRSAHDPKPPFPRHAWPRPPATTRPIKRNPRRRLVIEPVIGHMKNEHRMGSNHLVGEYRRCHQPGVSRRRQQHQAPSSRASLTAAIGHVGHVALDLAVYDPLQRGTTVSSV
jgi:hypothetical protein